MSKLVSKEWSETSDGGTRVTMHYSDGSSRDVTKEGTSKDNGHERLTITDHRPDGTSVTGDGVRSVPFFGTLEGAARVNSRKT